MQSVYVFNDAVVDSDTCLSLNKTSGVNRYHEIALPTEMEAAAMALTSIRLEKIFVTTFPCKCALLLIKQVNKPSIEAKAIKGICDTYRRLLWFLDACKRLFNVGHQHQLSILVVDINCWCQLRTMAFQMATTTDRLLHTRQVASFQKHRSIRSSRTGRVITWWIVLSTEGTCLFKHEMAKRISQVRSCRKLIEWPHNHRIAYHDPYPIAISVN